MGELRAVLELPAVERAPAAARAAIAAVLPVWGLTELVDDAQLLVSELFSNVVRHAPRADNIEVELLASGRRLRISLADGSAVRPVVRELTGDVPSGRGMAIVQAVASGWGVEDLQAGKRVWVELGDDPH